MTMPTLAMRPPLSLTPRLRTAYLSLIEKWAGLVLSEHQSRGLDEAIIQGMAQTGYTDPETWYQALASTAGRDLLERLAARMTIGETHFFRIAPQVEALRMTVLPELIKRRMSTRQLHIWSAGCSTGEEAYTLALLLREQLPMSNQWNLRLLATDLNDAALDIARAALYSEWSFRETPEQLRQKYFVQESNRWRLLPSIRNMVEFRQMNLITGSLPSQPSATPLDLIVCRNVTIYFGAQTTQHLYTRFAAALAPGGWLVLGPSDPPPQTALLEPVHLPGAILWRSVGTQLLVAQSSVRVVPANIGHPVGFAGQSSSRALAMVVSPLNPRVPPTARLRASPIVARVPVPQQAEQAVVLRPPDVETHLLLGLRQLDDGAIELAIESLRRATFLDEHNVLAHFGLGRAYTRAGHELRARAALTHARRLLASASEKQLAEAGMPPVNELRHAIEMQLASLDGKGTPR